MVHPMMDQFLARLRFDIAKKDKTATAVFHKTNSVVVDAYGAQSQESGVVEIETDRGLSHYSVYWTGNGALDWCWVAGGR